VTTVTFTCDANPSFLIPIEEKWVPGAVFNFNNDAPRMCYFKCSNKGKERCEELAFVAGKKHIEVLWSFLTGEEWAASKEGSSEALMRACLIGHTAAVKALLDRGAEVNLKDSNGWPPLMEAAFGGHANTIRALLERGADVNAKDRAGWTPLMEAASKGHLEAVIVLLAYGADANAKNVKGWTALKAAPKGNAEIIKLLKEAAARP